MPLSPKSTVIVVVLVIVASILGYLVGSQTTTRTVTQTRFDLAFVQNPSKCPNFGFVTPWRVALSDGESITSPPNANLFESYTSDGTTSTLTFHVPNGDYAYSVLPAGTFTTTNGVVTVNNQNATVYLTPVFATCGSIATATTKT